MDETIANLVEQLKRKLAEDSLEGAYADQYPPISLDRVVAAEQTLGFGLPQLLQILYTEVGNGGFGPYDGIVGLEGGWATNEGEGETLLELYQHYQLEFPFFSQWHWPSALLPICEDGYGVVCLDCSQPQSPVISFQVELPNSKGIGWELKLRQEAPSFQIWLEDWINRKHPNRK
jgi:hypothetical protein